jgi:hypothetical protein
MLGAAARSVQHARRTNRHRQTHDASSPDLVPSFPSFFRHVSSFGPASLENSARRAGRSSRPRPYRHSTSPRGQAPSTVRNFGARCLPRSGADDAWQWCGRPVAVFAAASGPCPGSRSSSDLPLCIARGATAHARARRFQDGELAPTPLESGTRGPHDARQLVAIPPRFARVITPYPFLPRP